MKATPPCSSVLALLLPSVTGVDEVQLVAAPQVGEPPALSVTAEMDVRGPMFARVGGVPIPGLPRFEMALAERRTLLVTETRPETEGSLESWERTYQELTWTHHGGWEMDAESKEWSLEAESPLVGSTVRFVADGDGRIAKEHVGEGAPELPEGMAARLDLHELLPGRPVAIGDRWEVGGEDLELLFAPGGDLAWEVPEDGLVLMMAVGHDHVLSGGLELTLHSVDEDGAASCAVRGTVKRSTTRDEAALPASYRSDDTQTIEEQWAVEGELVWDTSESRAQLLSLRGEFVREIISEREAESEAPAQESGISMTGSYTFLAERLPRDE